MKYQYFLLIILFQFISQVLSKRRETINKPQGREELEKAVDFIIERSKIEEIQELFVYANDCGLDILDAFEKLGKNVNTFQMISLNLQKNYIFQLSPIKTLIQNQKKLVELDLNFSESNNLSFLSGLEGMFDNAFYLSRFNGKFNDCEKLLDIGGFGHLEKAGDNLKVLSLSFQNTKLDEQDLIFLPEVIKHCKKIQTINLDFSGNQITSISFLKNLEFFDELVFLQLDFGNNKIKSLQGTQDLFKLPKSVYSLQLDFSENEIEDLSMLNGTFLDQHLYGKLYFSFNLQNGKEGMQCDIYSDLVSSRAQYIVFQKDQCIYMDGEIENCLSYQSKNICQQCGQLAQDIFAYNKIGGKGQCVEKCPDSSPIYQNGICLSECTYKTYSYFNQDNQRQQCGMCDNLCDKCEAENSCLQCHPITQFYEKGECRICPDNCKYCDKVQVCSSCEGAMVLHEKKCIHECPKLYVQVHGICNLIDCKEGKFLELDGTCSNCHSHCEKCFGTTSDMCIVCEKGYEFDQYRNCLKVGKGGISRGLVVVIIFGSVLGIIIIVGTFCYFRRKKLKEQSDNLDNKSDNKSQTKSYIFGQEMTDTSNAAENAKL